MLQGDLDRVLSLLGLFGVEVEEEPRSVPDVVDLCVHGISGGVLGEVVFSPNVGPFFAVPIDADFVANDPLVEEQPEPHARRRVGLQVIGLLDGDGGPLAGDRRLERDGNLAP